MNLNQNVLWIIGRGLYAYNFIRYCKNKYKFLTYKLITTDENDFSKKSNLFDEVVTIKYDNNNPFEYYCKIKNIVGNEIICPVNEETILLEYFDEIEEKLNFLFKRCKSKIFFHNKQNFMKLIENLDIPYIKTYFPNEKIIIKESDNYLLKKIYSRGAIGQRILENDKSYNFIVPDNYLLQTLITKKQEYSFFCVVVENNILEYVVYKCDEMIMGFSTKRIKISGSTSNKLYEYTNKILLAMKDRFGNYNGFLGIDFIESENIFYATDFNPRITNGIEFLTKNMSDTIISTIPYVTNKINYFNCFDLIKECLTYSNDLFYIDDLIPGLFSIIIIIWYVILACLNFVSPKEYIKNKIQKQIIFIDEKLFKM